MNSYKIWFNKNISSIFDVVELVKAADEPRELRLYVSHPDPDHPVKQLADHFEHEPSKLSANDYLDYCVDFVQRHQIDLFIPGKSLISIAEHRACFESIGVKLLIAAEAKNLHIIENKVSLYEHLGSELIPQPAYRLFTTVSEFESAYACMRPSAQILCFKPAVSIFGLGFKIIKEHGSPLDRMLRGETFQVGYDEAVRLFGERSEFRPMMLMEYLPGAERSIDCLANRGELIRSVIRKKPIYGDGPQEIETNPLIEEYASKITHAMQLHGQFNVQFRDAADGSPRLLEINPRMSGGLLYACLSGCCLPYWGIQLGLGRLDIEKVPLPKPGIRIAKVNRAITI
jgi:hypothetical protein